MMKSKKNEKQQIVEAGIAEAVQNTQPNRLNMHHVQILILAEIRDLLTVQNNLLRKQQGETTLPEKDALPEPEYKKGRRFWKWPKRK